MTKSSKASLAFLAFASASTLGIAGLTTNASAVSATDCESVSDVSTLTACFADSSITNIKLAGSQESPITLNLSDLGNSDAANNRITLNDNTERTLDLNYGKIIGQTGTFSVKHGKLSIKTGSLQTTDNNGVVVRVYGRQSDDGSYSKLDLNTVELTADGTGTASYGLAVFQSPEVTANAYGVTVDLTKVNIVAQNGMTALGNIRNGNPVINLKSGVAITNPTSGMGIYGAGAATWNIGYVDINSGVGIGAKAGTYNIKAAYVRAAGAYQQLTAADYEGSGIKNTGAALQIEDHAGYAGHVKFNITYGNFISENAPAFYEYESGSNLESLNITWAYFSSPAGMDTIVLPAAADNKVTISGGIYQSGVDQAFDVSKYLASGLIQNNIGIVAAPEEAYYPTYNDYAQDGVDENGYPVYIGALDPTVENSNFIEIVGTDIDNFNGGGKVYVDDKEVDSSNYKVTSGSVIITFTEEYLNTLKNGKHEIRVVFKDGVETTTKFMMKNSKELIPGGSGAGDTATEEDEIGNPNGGTVAAAKDSAVKTTILAAITGLAAVLAGVFVTARRVALRMLNK